MDRRQASKPQLRTADFNGFSAEHLTEVWKVYVWVAMKNGCYQRRQERCSLRLLVHRLNQLTTGTLGEVFLYLLYFKRKMMKQLTNHQQHQLNNAVLQKITDGDHAEFEDRYKSIPLILACYFGREDIMKNLLAEHHGICHQFKVMEMVYVGEPVPDLADLSDHPESFRYTPAFYAVSCDSHVGLQVLLQHGMLKISLRDLMISCVSLHAWKCLKLLFRQFKISKSVIWEGLRFACVKRYDFIRYFMKRGAEFNDDFLATYPNLLCDIFQPQVKNPAKCFHVLATIISSISPQRQVTLLNYSVLKSLIYRISYAPPERVDEKEADLFVKDIEQSFEAMIHANPNLVDEGRHDLIPFMLDLYHKLRKHKWLDSRIRLLKLFLRFGFEPVCGYHQTGVCALALLTDIFIRERRISGDRLCARAEAEMYDTFFQLLRAYLSQGCEPHHLPIEGVLVTRLHHLRSLGGSTWSVIIADLQIRLETAVRSHSALWRAASQFPTVRWLRRKTLYQYLLSHYRNGHSCPEELASLLHLCACVTLHTDFSHESEHPEFFTEVRYMFSSCLACYQYKEEQTLGEFLLFLFSFLDKNQRGTMAGELGIDAVLESSKSPSEGEPDTYSYVKQVHTLLTTCMTLRETCILLIRNLILQNRRVVTKTLKYHVASAESYWIPEEKEQTVEQSYPASAIRSPILDLIETNLLLPKSLCRETAGVEFLSCFLSKMWIEAEAY